MLKIKKLWTVLIFSTTAFSFSDCFAGGGGADSGKAANTTSSSGTTTGRADRDQQGGITRSGITVTATATAGVGTSGNAGNVTSNGGTLNISGSGTTNAGAGSSGGNSNSNSNSGSGGGGSDSGRVNGLLPQVNVNSSPALINTMQSVLNTLSSTKVGTAITNLNSNLVQKAAAISQTMASEVYRKVEPHLAAAFNGAVQAGKVASQARYELSIKSRVYDSTTDSWINVPANVKPENYMSAPGVIRAMYTGIYNSYEQQNISLNRRVFPTGPMADLTRIRISDSVRVANGSAQSEVGERAMVEQIDTLYRAGKISFLTPGGSLFVPPARSGGAKPLYEAMTPVQRVGMNNSVLILGHPNSLASVESILNGFNSLYRDINNDGVINSLDDSAQGIGLLDQFKDRFKGGVVLINNEETNLASTVSHEYNHAGVDSVVDDLIEKLRIEKDPIKIQNYQKRLDKVLPLDIGIGLEQIDPSLKGLVNDEYLNTPTEYLAFTEELNHEFLDRLVESSDLTENEARVVTDKIANSHVLQKSKEALEEHANEMLQELDNE
jgi:hypothetical protein